MSLSLPGLPARQQVEGTEEQDRASLPDDKDGERNLQHGNRDPGEGTDKDFDDHKIGNPCAQQQQDSGFEVRKRSPPTGSWRNRDHRWLRPLSMHELTSSSRVPVRICGGLQDTCHGARVVRRWCERTNPCGKNAPSGRQPDVPNPGSHTWCRESECQLRVQRGTGIIELLVSL